MLEKKGTLRKLNGPPPKIVRLVSSAEYTRPVNLASSGSLGTSSLVTTSTGATITVPPVLNSTYRRTLCEPVSNTEDMYNRCVEARFAKKRGTMVKDAVSSLPLDILDRVNEETLYHTEETIHHAREQTQRLEQTAHERSIPYTTPAIEELSATLHKEPRHPQQHVLVNTFFTEGSSGGPFPGQTSELGKVLAGAYWTESARLGNTKLVMGKPASKFAPGGYKLTNFNHL